MTHALRHITKRRAVLGLFSSVLLSLFAAEPLDTGRVVSLDSLVVSGKDEMYRRSDDGKLTLDVSKMAGYIQTLGEADPVKYLQMLPGVHATDDYASGFSVEGFNYSQSLVEIDGAPVFFPYHFGGIFSLLNPRYFKNISFRRVFPSLEATPRLGALLNANSPSRISKRLKAEASVGIISSGLSAEIPVGRKVQVSLAGRISYLNQLMGPFLKNRDSEYRYDLADWNASVLYLPGKDDMLKLNVSGNVDHLGYYDGRYLNDTHVDWSNQLASLQWEHSGERFNVRTSAWYSYLGSKMTVGMSGLDARMWSRISQYGARVAFHWPGDRGNRLRWGVEASASSTGIRPARVESSWALIGDIDTGKSHALESTLMMRCEATVTDNLHLDGRVGGAFYESGGFRRVLPSALLAMESFNGNNIWRVELSAQPQFFHQVGFSEIGLASNFWIGSGNSAPAEKAYGVSADWSHSWGAGFESSVAPYFKWIEDEAEYGGGVFDLLEENFNPYRHMLAGSGYNVGVDLSLKHTAGKITGWVSYSFGLARRRFSDHPAVWTRSAREILNVVKLFVAWRISDHWQVGANFNYSTGRPITPVTEVYVLANNIIMGYGDRNSGRLPAYHRLDISGSYSFDTGGRMPLHHSVNISLLNAYGHNNVEFTHFRYNPNTGQIYQKFAPSLFRFLPSLSYSIRF